MGEIAENGGDSVGWVEDGEIARMGEITEDGGERRMGEIVEDGGDSGGWGR